MKKTKTSPHDGTVAERIRAVSARLTPAELAVANKLLAKYPMAGLVPIVQLATEAEVSAPTVTRLVSKLGFSGYGDFHKALRAEVQTRMFSPVDVYPGGNNKEDARNSTAIARTAYLDAINSTFLHLEERELDGAVSVLADPARPVLVLGGRFSHVLAQHLVAYISMLRAGVAQVGRDSGGRIAGIIDVGPRSVAVVYDFRRYQQTSVDWGLAAVARGAHLIVITDQFLSPLAPRATSLLTCSNVGLGPFDSMTGGFALTEFLFAAVARKMGAPARKRLAQFEQFQIQEEKTRGGIT
jgi:DNA-binding MurR/RpiR family transcriptional regulator